MKLLHAQNIREKIIAGEGTDEFLGPPYLCSTFVSHIFYRLVHLHFSNLDLEEKISNDLKSIDVFVWMWRNKTRSMECFEEEMCNMKNQQFIDSVTCKNKYRHVLSTLNKEHLQGRDNSSYSTKTLSFAKLLFVVLSPDILPYEKSHF